MSPNNEHKLPMKAIVVALASLFVALCGLFLIMPAFFDIHVTDAFFDVPQEPWMLPPAERSRLGMSIDEMKGKYHFEQMCASCHGAWALGGGPQAARLGGVPSLVAPETRSRLVNGLSRAGILKTLDEGIAGSAMPAFPHLARHVRDTLADFILYAERNQDTLMGANGASGTSQQPDSATNITQTPNP